MPDNKNSKPSQTAPPSPPWRWPIGRWITVTRSSFASNSRSRSMVGSSESSTKSRRHLRSPSAAVDIVVKLEDVA